MSDGGNIERSRQQDCHVIYYQIGAPSLIYENHRDASSSAIDAEDSDNDNKDDDHRFHDLDSYHNTRNEDDDRVLDMLPISGSGNGRECGRKSRRIDDDWKRRIRVRSYWYYPPKVSSTRNITMQTRQRQRWRRQMQEDEAMAMLHDEHDSSARNFTLNPRDPFSQSSIDKNRIRMLLEKDDENEKKYNGGVGLEDYDSDEDRLKIRRHCRLIETSSLFEYPFLRSAKNAKPRKNASTSMSTAQYLTRQFNKRRINNSDPSYLAPFDSESISEATKTKRGHSLHSTHGRLGRGDVQASSSYKNQRIGLPPRQHQGNTLLTLSCPLKCCTANDCRNSDDSGDNRNASWALLHPVGPILEKLRVSKLRSQTTDGNEDKTRNKHAGRSVEENVIDLGDTILEVQQCGPWTKQSPPETTVIVRTGSTIYVVSIRCQNVEHDANDDEGRECLQEDSEATGSASHTCQNPFFTLEKREQFDYRSMYRSVPSLYPVSLTSHPRFVMPFSPSKFAVAYHSSLPSPSHLSLKNIVHSYSYDGINGKLVSFQQHNVSNLRNVDLVDFTSHHPMCLWSAASSHVRPCPTTGVYDAMIGQKKAPFGLGNSLYSIDLRTNKGTFQWSPSAEEMVTEGIHSINGVHTDWNSENLVLVTSRSAGKTWQIDGRMPCRVVNFWSLTSTCDESVSSKVPSVGFHGEPSLLTTARSSTQSHNRRIGASSWPIIKVDTDYGINGISMFQCPKRRPRFQTESVQCIASHAVSRLPHASVAMSSYFSLPDVSESTYVCGISTIRMPLSHFVNPENVDTNGVDDDDDNAQGSVIAAWRKCCQSKRSTVLGIITATNHGDVYQHALLESNGQDDEDSCGDDDEAMTEHLGRFEGLPIGTTSIPIPTSWESGIEDTGGLAQRSSSSSSDIKLILTNTYPTPFRARVRRNKSEHDFSVDTHRNISIRKRQRHYVSCVTSKSKERNDVCNDCDDDNFKSNEDTRHASRSRVDYNDDCLSLERKTNNTTLGVRLSSIRTKGQNNEVSILQTDDDADGAGRLILPKQSPYQPKIHVVGNSHKQKNHSATSRKSDLSNGVLQRAVDAFDNDTDDEGVDDDDENDVVDDDGRHLHHDDDYYDDVDA